VCKYVWSEYRFCIRLEFETVTDDEGYIFLNYHHNVYIDLTLIRIGVVIGSMLALDVVDCGFQERWGKNKDNKIGICTLHKGATEKTDRLGIRIIN